MYGIKTKLFEKYDDHYDENSSSFQQLGYENHDRQSIEEVRSSRSSEISVNEEFSKQGQLILQQIIMITKSKSRSNKDRELFSEQGELIQQAMAIMKSKKHNRKMMTSSPTTTAIHMIDNAESKLFDQYIINNVEFRYKNNQ